MAWLGGVVKQFQELHRFTNDHRYVALDMDAEASLLGEGKLVFGNAHLGSMRQTHISPQVVGL